MHVQFYHRESLLFSSNKRHVRQPINCHRTLSLAEVRQPEILRSWEGILVKKKLMVLIL